MGIKTSADYEEKFMQLSKLMAMREQPRQEIDQKYQTIESVIDRIDHFKSLHLLEGHRILTIGDADLTGLAIAVFGNPREVVVADIDDRLSEIYFEAHLEYDLPVRYVYHDMRIKIIAILKRQYTLVLVEPPRTKEGISLFLSRALEILEPGDDHRLIVTVPQQEELISHLQLELDSYGITIEQKIEGVNRYDEEYSIADDYVLSVPNDVKPRLTDHHLDPVYEAEVVEKIHEYKCKCESTFTIGETATFANKAEATAKGCPICGSHGPFVYDSKIARM